MGLARLVSRGSRALRENNGAVNFSDNPDLSGDPGWGGALRGVAWGFIPQLGIRVQQRRAATGRIDRLTMLRSLFLSFLSSTVMIGVVVLLLANFGKLNRDSIGIPPTVVAIVLAAIGPGRRGQMFPAASHHEPGPLGCRLQHSVLPPPGFLRVSGPRRLRGVHPHREVVDVPPRRCLHRPRIFPPGSHSGEPRQRPGRHQRHRKQPQPACRAQDHVATTATMTELPSV
jgi:hypothetical protein